MLIDLITDPKNVKLVSTGSTYNVDDKLIPMLAIKYMFYCMYTSIIV